MSIPQEEFSAILKELERKPVEVNIWRKISGVGRSQAFGVVGRRCLAPDYSKNCWGRPYLYKLLLEFGDKHCPFPYNAITVNQNYQASRHRDKNNVGDSFLVAFGSYTGGELEIFEGDLKGLHNINGSPIVADFSTIDHAVRPFEGSRYSLVFYTYASKRWPVNLPPPSVKSEMVRGKEKWFFYRGDEKITNGLPHPLKGRRIGGALKGKKIDPPGEGVENLKSSENPKP